MRIQLFSIVTALLMVSPAALSAPKKALPAKEVKVTKKKASTKVMDVEKELENELNSEIQDEPTTTIEAAPLQPSKSSMMREERRQLEMATEEGVVQELEASRIADEKTRRERVFGSPSTQQVSTEVETEDEDSKFTYYMGVTGGLVDPRADNVSGAGAAGFSLGAKYPVNMTPIGMGSVVVEGGFIYSLLEGETRTLTSVSDYDVDKYGVSGAIKYEIQSGWFIPGAGLVMAYTRRQFKIPGEDSFSNAADAGLTVSGDVALNKSVSIGVEYRYMTNLDYEKDSGTSPADVAAQSAATSNEIRNLEDIDYQMLLLNGKISF